MVVTLVISQETASWSLKSLRVDGSGGRKAVTAVVEGLIRP
ncbi:hypothetical protein SAMN04488564_111121 [Lentzea waywayandensis]|uniref:Uncharacterized protein n=1 Tax=Lentzea waywayandensis TaxID=84724 RepID=A0A1I6FC75_9PSEU|nr:hypothetical protein SAMN04488564_111121 [Lentzea waywayandensis]